MKRLLVAALVASTGLVFTLSGSSSGAWFSTGAAAPFDGDAIYSQNCSKCHGDDGRAQTKKGRQLRATDFTDPKWQRGITDTKAVRIITNGHEEMPAFKDTLSVDQIREVMSYVRRFKR